MITEDSMSSEVFNFVNVTNTMESKQQFINTSEEVYFKVRIVWNLIYKNTISPFVERDSRSVACDQVISCQLNNCSA